MNGFNQILVENTQMAKCNALVQISAYMMAQANSSDDIVLSVIQEPKLT
jgi:hypothetical protein